MRQFDYNYEAYASKRPFFDAILAILPGAVIAGGYLRDLLLNKPVRDLDILTETVPTQDQLNALGDYLGVSMCRRELPAATEDYEPEEAGRSSNIRIVFKDAKAEVVDILVVDDIQTRIREFPDSTSRVWFATEYGLRYASEFVYAHANKLITYREEGPSARLQKLVAKFPGYVVKLIPGYGLNAQKYERMTDAAS